MPAGLRARNGTMSGRHVCHPQCSYLDLCFLYQPVPIIRRFSQLVLQSLLCNIPGERPFLLILEETLACPHNLRLA